MAQKKNIHNFECVQNDVQNSALDIVISFYEPTTYKELLTSKNIAVRTSYLHCSALFSDSINDEKYWALS